MLCPILFGISLYHTLHYKRPQGTLISILNRCTILSDVIIHTERPDDHKWHCHKSGPISWRHEGHRTYSIPSVTR
jgi:hypothetical protein